MELNRESQPAQRLASALEGRLFDVLTTWGAAVRRDVAAALELTPTELRDAMPTVLGDVCRAMADGRTAAFVGLARQASEHGTRRFLQRYTVTDLLVEYQLLRQAVVGHAAAGADGGLTTAEVLALNRAVDAVCEGAVTSFHDAQRAHLERAAEVEAKFLSFLAHDQRNHLNHALLLLEIHSVELVQYPGLAQSAADLREVREAIRQTAEGMERLMQAERLRRGAVEPDRHPLCPADLVRSVVAGFAAEAAGKGLQIEPVVTDATTITSDPALLGLVLTNLVGNAIKFSAAGVVRVSAEPASAGRWRFTVADQGPGIVADAAGRLFDAFVRGETHGQGGMGLGLSIASQAARLLGGLLTVESTVGVGSTFTLDVPGTT